MGVPQGRESEDEVPEGEADEDGLVRLQGSINLLGQKIDDLDRLISERFNARDLAILQVAEDTQRVQAQQNEWRGALSDLTNSKIDRSEYLRAHDALTERFNNLQSRVDATTGGAGLTQKVVTAIAVGIALLSLIGTLAIELTH